LQFFRRSLASDAAHAIVRPTVRSRLDYCNSIADNAPLGLLNCSQPVFMRYSARLVLRLPPPAGVSELMRDQLHWLPVQQRIKLCIVARRRIHRHAYPPTSIECGLPLQGE